jgi:molybdate transport system permease protein
MADPESPPRRSRRPLLVKWAFGFLALFIGSAVLAILANLAEWHGTWTFFVWRWQINMSIVDFFAVTMWISLLLYFFAAALSIDTGNRGWSGRLFSAGTFFFLAAFVAFALFLIISDAFYIDKAAVVKVATSSYIAHSLYLSIVTSAMATLLALVFAIPMGYALSRYSFPGRLLADTLVDIPIVFPPLVAGLTLLVFFSQTTVGKWIEQDLGLAFMFKPKGIVLCQFVVSASFAIRSVKTAFDEVDRRLENVALTLGCTEWTGFLRVSLPLARGGVVAGAILAWARAFGIFGPLMIFVGSFRGETEVLSTSIYREQSVGNLEESLTVALLMIVVALVALVTVRLVGGRALVRL